MGRVHLHRDDCPQALAVLAEVLVARRHDPVGLAAIGYEPSEYGVWVDWDQLERSWLSSTEVAAVVVARGVAAAERQGGWPARIRRVLVAAVEAL
ncbi:MAG: hypothetical protein ACRD2C_08780 [Acidimicrobiales bacterium]